MLKLLIFSCYTYTSILAGAREKSFFEFYQNDHKITFERMELCRYDKRYVNASMVTYKYNRTTPVGNNPEMVTQAYKFLSNEYRYFPLRFQVNSCEALKTNIIGVGAIRKCGNFTGCPILKGVTYHICKWTINEEKFAPLVPNGQYRLELQGMYKGIELTSVYLYATISRPIPWN